MDEKKSGLDTTDLNFMLSLIFLIFAHYIFFLFFFSDLFILDFHVSKNYSYNLILIIFHVKYIFLEEPVDDNVNVFRFLMIMIYVI